MSEVRTPHADTIEQTPTQIDNYLVRPEFFSVRSYNDPITEPFHGQSTNSPEAQKRSREEFNRGSQRAEGNVNHAAPPHIRLERREEEGPAERALRGGRSAQSEELIAVIGLAGIVANRPYRKLLFGRVVVFKYISSEPRFPGRVGIVDAPNQPNAGSLTRQFFPWGIHHPAHIFNVLREWRDNTQLNAWNHDRIPNRIWQFSVLANRIFWQAISRDSKVWIEETVRDLKSKSCSGGGCMPAILHLPFSSDYFLADYPFTIRFISQCQSAAHRTEPWTFQFEGIVHRAQLPTSDNVVPYIRESNDKSENGNHRTGVLRIFDETPESRNGFHWIGLLLGICGIFCVFYEFIFLYLAFEDEGSIETFFKALVLIAMGWTGSVVFFLAWFHDR